MKISFIVPIIFSFYHQQNKTDSPPTFRWSVGESFRNFEIQFSTDPAFQSIPVKVRLPGSFNEKAMNPSPWKRVLKLSGETGGTIYWRVTRTRSDRRIVESDIRSLIVEPALPVGFPTISGTAKSSLPTLSWQNNCNKKFKVWFGGDDQFSTRVSFLFNVTDPTKNGGAFTKQVTPTQWMAVRRLVGEAGGSPIYWYVESWDDVSRISQPGTMFFLLAD